MTAATCLIFVFLSWCIAFGATAEGKPLDYQGDSLSEDLAPESFDSRVELGPAAVDTEGRRGRIHHVVPGDTLWGISAAYLGTPWVWPSVWRDNEEIANPHLIYPDDRIWITAGEMRKVTPEEADQMIAAQREQRAAAPAPRQESEYLPATEPSAEPSLRTVQVVERAAMGFLSPDSVHAASSIVDSPSERTWLAEGDVVYLGLGDGEVATGDEFTIFRDPEPVYDVGRGHQLGYHVEILGWLRVKEVRGESAVAQVTQSRSALSRGDRIIPREPVPARVDVKYTPTAQEGAIVFTPGERTQMGDGDHVYLNRGTLHGFEVGSQVEVFTPGSVRPDEVSGRTVRTPDHVIAKMVLVELSAGTSVALVGEASRALEVGDRVRPASEKLAAR